MSKDRIIFKNGNDQDYLTRYDEVSNPRQVIEINQSSTLEFQLERNDPKWRYFEKPGTTAECNGRVYCIIGDSPISRQRDTSGTHLPVVMKEIWYKLAKKYITAYNFDIDKSEKFDHVDQHMVALWGNSSDPLYINGARVTNPYAVGTAQYLFYCILYGSGWTLDSRYANYWPSGKFDLETDKKSVLDNLKLLQEFFGGMLFWDSKNKLVALVDEEKYQPYEGFEIRYRKNLVGVKKTEDHDITTRLYVYGNSHLNIAAVNNNREYIDNFSYTSDEMEDVIVNNDIYEQSSLLQWGKMQSARLAKPRYSYEVDFIRYAEAAKVAIPQPEIGKLAKIFDADIVGTPAMQRIRKIDQHVFVEYDCNVICGDVIGTFERTFRDVQDGSGKADDTISGGGKIPGVDIEGNIPQLDKEANNIYNEIKSVDGNLRSLVSQTAYEIRTEVQNVEKGLQTTISQTAEAIRLEAVDMEKRLSASITITAAEIRSEVRDVQNGLSSSISQTAAEIRSEVRDVQNGLSSSISQTAAEIRSEVRDVKSGLESTISQTAGEIRQEVSSVDGRLTKVSQTVDNISSEVYDRYGRSLISQNADQISLVVEGTGNNKKIKAAEIVAEINKTGSSVKISADKVDISADLVTFSDLSGTGKKTVIRGDYITTGTIDAGKVTVKNLYADQVSFTTSNGNRIKVATASFGTLYADSFYVGRMWFNLNSSGSSVSRVTAKRTYNFNASSSNEYFLLVSSSIMS